MTLNHLLSAKDIDPATVLIMRHRPHEPQLRKVLGWLVAERPSVFNAYQQTQPPRVEKAMKSAGHLASFVGDEAGRATLAGIYKIGDTQPITRKRYLEIPEHRELARLGSMGVESDDVLLFDLHLTDIYAEWKGKLVVGWPPPERSWWRRAHRNEMPVIAIHEESVFDAAMPSWEDLSLSWEQLQLLPTRWRQRLGEWRAIYFIFDSSDGKGYVGSAYGGENLLGRWLNYAARGHGGNVLLRQREPRDFAFSILQRVSPDMDAGDVIRLETTWKERLHTRRPFGLNEN